jgi:hypothetical protein
MRTKRNTNLATWLALAMGIAAATSVEAAMVQITLNQTYTATSATGFIDLTGDGVVDGMRFDAGPFEGIPQYYIEPVPKPVVPSAAGPSAVRNQA